MKISNRSARTRERILEAAVNYIDEGGTSFSLDEIARLASISKGGLLYNFPTKNALIKAIIEYYINDLEQGVADAEAELADDPYPNKLARALLIGIKQRVSCKEQVHSGILVAIGEDNSLLDAMRRFNQNLYSRILEESENPELASLVYMAIEGVRAQKLFDILPATFDQTIEKFDYLIELLKRDVSLKIA
ncbi:TetR/AcrR family transcriptional regulator [Polycladidibacter stylochi]|uniref:TetR/AcrR family transcriptional regulator n=1 Tax=Polycladidibacter stylochi TaxID=1807766 RepID=UPI00082F65AC|nr:TetR/AcrR family transcriptional regulator [Pseudovibrio stylochi]